MADRKSTVSKLAVRKRVLSFQVSVSAPQARLLVSELQLCCLNVAAS